MFESLQQGLSDAFKSLRGKGKLTDSNMREGLQQVQQALLEADVSFPVARDFIARIAEEAVGEKVLSALDPSQQVVGIVYRELIELMGPVDHSLHFQSGVTVLMLCGLQGSGKTTTCGKLGRLVKEAGRQPLLVAADLQRPAAIDQLHVIGDQLGIPVFSERGAADPVAVCQHGIGKAAELGCSVVILDTAGRLHIDQELMDQLRRIDQRVKPHQVYLVVDGMTGQDAVNSAQAFNEALELDGAILTKLDGDARGGAILSVKAVTGVPVKFIGTGEHLDALQEFHPERMAQRILGMGDVLTLVEEAQQKFDQEEMQRQQEQLAKGQFSLDDFRKMLTQTQRLGPLNKILGLLPGMGGMKELMQNSDTEAEFRRLRGVIDSMTPAERRNPSKLIDQSRRRRIAAGAGVEPQMVNELVKQFDGMAAMMRDMSRMSLRDRMRALQQLQHGFADPTAQFRRPRVGTGKRLTTAEKAKLRKQREREAKKRKWGETRNPSDE